MVIEVRMVVTFRKGVLPGKVHKGAFLDPDLGSDHAGLYVCKSSIYTYMTCSLDFVSPTSLWTNNPWGLLPFILSVHQDHYLAVIAFCQFIQLFLNDTCTVLYLSSLPTHLTDLMVVTLAPNMMMTLGCSWRTVFD